MRAVPFICLLVAAPLAAQVAVPDDPLEALVRDSPFLPPAGMTRTAAAGEGGPLEFRSVVFERGQFSFSIYDQAARESKWVTFGQQDLPFVVRSYDQEQDILTVDHQGRSLALKLQPAHTAGQLPSGAATTPPPLPSAEEAARRGEAGPANPPSVPPASQTLDPAQSRRLEQMADEIRRRRQQPVQPSQN